MNARKHLLQIGHVAPDAVEAFDHDEGARPLDGAFPEQPVEIAGLVVAEGADVRAAQARRGENAGMAVGVEKNGIPFPGQSGDDPEIGHESGAEYGRVALVVEPGNFRLEIEVHPVIAGRHPRRGRAGAGMPRGRDGRLDGAGVEIQPEIAVGAEQQGRPAADYRFDRARHVLDDDAQRIVVPLDHAIHGAAKCFRAAENSGRTG